MVPASAKKPAKSKDITPTDRARRTADVSGPVVDGASGTTDQCPPAANDGLLGLQAVVLALETIGLYSEYKEVLDRIRIALEHVPSGQSQSATDLTGADADDECDASDAGAKEENVAADETASPDAIRLDEFMQHLRLLGHNAPTYIRHLLDTASQRLIQLTFYRATPLNSSGLLLRGVLETWLSTWDFRQSAEREMELAKSGLRIVSVHFPDFVKPSTSAKKETLHR